MRAVLEQWNRKLHFYLGLYLLFFVWLFALSGLLLNHPNWAFAESWNNRSEKNVELPLAAGTPEKTGDLAQAQEVMKQLGIEGEILWTTEGLPSGISRVRIWIWACKSNHRSRLYASAPWLSGY